MVGMISRLRQEMLSVVGWLWVLLGGGPQQPATERDHVRQFLEFVEDRRVLFTPYFLE
jgi:hypothetical protein